MRFFPPQNGWPSRLPFLAVILGLRLVVLAAIGVEA